MKGRNLIIATGFGLGLLVSSLALQTPAQATGKTSGSRTPGIEVPTAARVVLESVGTRNAVISWNSPTLHFLYNVTVEPLNPAGGTPRIFRVRTDQRTNKGRLSIGGLQPAQPYRILIQARNGVVIKKGNGKVQIGQQSRRLRTIGGLTFNTTLGDIGAG